MSFCQICRGPWPDGHEPWCPVLTGEPHSMHSSVSWKQYADEKRTHYLTPYVDTDHMPNRRCGGCGKPITGRMLIIGKGKQKIDSTGRWRGLSIFCEDCAKEANAFLKSQVFND